MTNAARGRGSDVQQPCDEGRCRRCPGTGPDGRPLGAALEEFIRLLQAHGVWKNAAFQGYANYLLTPEFAQSLQELIRHARSERAARLCAEAVPWRCHRSLSAAPHASRAGKGWCEAWDKGACARAEGDSRSAMAPTEDSVADRSAQHYLSAERWPSSDHLLSSAIPWPSTFFSLRTVLPNHLQTVALPHCRALGAAFAFSATR
jgi:Protein of unknown function, DUF488